MAKVGFVSLGCPKNLVDSEVMVGILQKDGHTLTTDISDAEVIVVNTCAFIRDSKQESIDAILAAAQLKGNGRCRRLVVAGCLAERYPQQIRKELAEVDALLGTNQVLQISRAVEGETVPPPASFGRGDADLYLYDHTTPRTLIGPRYAAYMKISEGCDHTCSFCVIPKIRGRCRSRSMDSLVEEARGLAAQGVRELTLVSQDTTAYGTDLGLKNGLTRMLEALSRVEGIRWVRFLYMYPNLVEDSLLELMSSSDRICKYVDMPLQHVSSRILKLMRRGGNRAALTRLVEHIRDKVPRVTLRTTMIVGFPGETEKDFRELMSFCREMEFDRLGVFEYSDEEDTSARDLENKVAKRISARRRGALMRQQAEISRKRNRRLVGREFPILVEGLSQEGEFLLQGRLESQAPEIDGVCLITDAEVRVEKAGEFHTVRITRALEHDLLGTLVR